MKSVEKLVSEVLYGSRLQLLPLAVGVRLQEQLGKARGRHHVDRGLLEIAVRCAVTSEEISKPDTSHCWRHPNASTLLERGHDTQTSMIDIHKLNRVPYGISSQADSSSLRANVKHLAASRISATPSKSGRILAGQRGDASHPGEIRPNCCFAAPKATNNRKDTTKVSPMQLDLCDLVGLLYNSNRDKPGHS